LVYNHETMQKKLIQWIVLSQQPFTIIEEPSFHSFVKVLHPTTKLPTANTVKKYIMDFYTIEIQRVKEILQSVPGKISFTIDIWTSPSMKSFLAITAHFINVEWELQSIILDFIQIWGSHTGENIKKIFVTCLESYGIQTKVSFF
jgi:hypothetical protein